MPVPSGNPAGLSPVWTPMRQQHGCMDGAEIRRDRILNDPEFLPASELEILSSAVLPGVPYGVLEACLSETSEKILGKELQRIPPVHPEEICRRLVRWDQGLLHDGHA